MSNAITKLCRPLILPRMAKAVLMALADYADDSGTAWPSIPTVQRWTGFGRTAVMSGLRALEDDAWMRIERKAGGYNVMRLDLKRIGAESWAQEAIDRDTSKPGRPRKPRSRATGGNRENPRAVGGRGGAKTPVLLAKTPVLLATKGSAAGDKTPSASSTRSISEASLKHQEASGNGALNARSPRRSSRVSASADSGNPGMHKRSAEGVTVQTAEAYSQAYAARYGAPPVIAAKERGQLANFVKALGVEAAPQVAAFYVQSQKPFYVERLHPIWLLLKDAPALHTLWKTGRVAPAPSSGGHGARKPPQSFASTMNYDQEL